MNSEKVLSAMPARRGFMKTIGLAGVGIGAFITNVKQANAQTVTDADIVQFALNLEYLEAEFYTMARSGKTIDTMGVGITGSGNAAATTGGSKVVMTEGSTLAQSSDAVAADERAHVMFLRNTLTSLGIQPIAKPAINLAALGTGFESQEAFINVARTFEDVGVSAYGGAAPLLTSKVVLGYAARILATEAEHTGNLRLHSALYQAAGTPADAIDIVPPPTGVPAPGTGTGTGTGTTSGVMPYFTTDNRGLTPTRTPGQVLYIVYGGKANVTQGGFFPAGVNGSLNMSSAGATTFPV